MERPTVAVIGGGISGLVSAARLESRGADVLVFEASPDLGGQVRSVELSGRTIDVGAESLHIGAPPVRELVRLLGMNDRLIVAAPSSAWIWADHGLHRVPEGVGPAGPTKLGPILRSRLLSTGGMIRAAFEPLARRSKAVEDVSVGHFITHRFGHEVTERFVDPFLGTLHSGDVDRLSLHAVAPQLASITEHHRSLLLAYRARKEAPAPSFATFAGGLPILTRRLADICGATIYTSTRVTGIEPMGSRWRIEGDGATLAEVDAVVLAVPARTASMLLAPLVPEASRMLAEIRSASVATVVVAYPRDAVEASAARDTTGLLVPSMEGHLLKAATFLSAKWHHLEHPEHFFVRLSAGRAGQAEVAELDDATLVARLHDDLAGAIGITAAPVASHVERWNETMPQLEVGHLSRLAAIRGEVTDQHPTLVLAGASFDGPGLAACIRSGDRAANELAVRLAEVVATA